MVLEAQKRIKFKYLAHKLTQDRGASLDNKRSTKKTTKMRSIPLLANGEKDYPTPSHINRAVARGALASIEWDGEDPGPVVGLLQEIGDEMIDAGVRVQDVARQLRAMAEVVEGRAFPQNVAR